MRRALLVTGGVTPGSVETSLWGAPDYSAGDAQFLTNDPTMPVQLRPVLASEQTPGRFYGPGDRMLVHLGPSPIELRALVRMKPGSRENTRRNVEQAIRQVGKFNPSIGAAFRLALRGRATANSRKEKGRSSAQRSSRKVFE